MPKLQTNTLYYGDNLEVLRDHIPDDSVDLIFLDPPFNSNRSYNALFKEAGKGESPAQIEAFEDTWHPGESANRGVRLLITVCDAAAEDCPVFPGAPQRIHWSFTDPAAAEGNDEEKLRAFQRTVREMKTRLLTFVPVAKRNASLRA